MRSISSYIGKIAGTLLGLTMGIFGALFGLLIGHLIDSILGEQLLIHQAWLFLKQPIHKNISPYYRHIYTLALLCVYILRFKGHFKAVLKEQATSLISASILLSDQEKSRLENTLDLFIDIAWKDKILVEEPLLIISGDKNLSRDEKALILRLLLDIREILQNGEQQDHFNYIIHCFGFESLNTPWEKSDDLDEAYTLLGVTSACDLRKIKKTYRTLAAQFHPDRGQDLSARQRKASNEAFLKIKQAYDTIMRVKIKK